LTKQILAGRNTIVIMIVAMLAESGIDPEVPRVTAAVVMETAHEIGIAQGNETGLEKGTAHETKGAEATGAVTMTIANVVCLMMNGFAQQRTQLQLHRHHLCPLAAIRSCLKPRRQPLTLRPLLVLRLRTWCDHSRLTAPQHQ
jgi:hypothetical protein